MCGVQLELQLQVYSSQVVATPLTLELSIFDFVWTRLRSGVRQVR